MAEAWSPVQIQLAGSPPVGGGLPVGCLASCWRRPVPGAGLAATEYLLERQLWYSVLIWRYVHTIKIEVPGKKKIKI